MKLSPEALETMGESASDGLIHPYVWGPALVGAAQQIKELQAALSTAEADRKALMEVAKQARVLDKTATVNDYGEWTVDDAAYGALSMVLSALPAHLRSEAEGKKP